jgi:hypothetical protein
MLWLLPRQLVGETASADHALRTSAGALAELAIRGDQPVRRARGRLAGDPVVGELAARADDVVGLDRRTTVEDDERLDAVLGSPVADELDERLGGDVRPERALDVASVDDEGRGDRGKLTEPQYQAGGPPL